MISNYDEVRMGECAQSLSNPIIDLRLLPEILRCQRLLNPLRRYEICSFQDG